MSVISQHVVGLIAKQVEDRQLVVWYDPEAVYTSVAEALMLPETTVARYQGSFFRLRQEIDVLMNDLQPPRLVVYMPFWIRARLITPWSSWRRQVWSCSRASSRRSGTLDWPSSHAML